MPREKKSSKPSKSYKAGMLTAKQIRQLREDLNATQAQAASLIQTSANKTVSLVSRGRGPHRGPRLFLHLDPQSLLSYNSRRRKYVAVPQPPATL